MESTYSIFNIIVGFWIATWLMLFIKTYVPSMKTIGAINPHTIVYKYKYFGGLVYAVLLLPATPFLIGIVLDDQKKERFLQSFTKSLLGETK